MITIHGCVADQDQMTNHNLQTLLASIAKEFPEIAQCRPEAISLLLDDLLIVVSPDHRTLPIKSVDRDDDEGEIVDLLRARLATEANEDGVDAWILIAYGSEHRSQPQRHEVIVRQAIAVHTGMQCQLQIHRQGMFLPYRDCRTIIV